MSSLTLPKSGGLVNGELSERPMLVPPTAENASSSLLATPTTMDNLPPREGAAYEKAKLHGGRTKRKSSGNLREEVIHSLPTPQSRDYKDMGLGEPHGQGQVNLPQAIHTLPTPHAGLGERGRDGVYLNPKGQQDLQHTLAHLLPTPLTTDYNTPASEWTPDRDSLQLRDIAHLLPTPAVNDMGAGKDPRSWNEWAARQKAADGRPAPHGKSLEQEALAMLPTPTAQAAKHALDDRGKGTPDDCNLWSVAGRLIGENTPLQSDDGNLF